MPEELMTAAADINLTPYQRLLLVRAAGELTLQRAHGGALARAVFLLSRTLSRFVRRRPQALESLRRAGQMLAHQPLKHG